VIKKPGVAPNRKKKSNAPAESLLKQVEQQAQQESMSQIKEVEPSKEPEPVSVTPSKMKYSGVNMFPMGGIPMGGMSKSRFFYY
jgi:hypothetical protein